MKKLISAALTLTMLLSLSSTVFAADLKQDSDPSQTDATISATINPTYTVTIPADTIVPFEANSTPFGAIEATAVQIEPNMKITVSVTAGMLVNAKDSTQKIPYSIRKDDNLFTSFDILKKGDKANLTIDIAKADWKLAAAGSYSDKVIFTLQYEKK